MIGEEIGIGAALAQNVVEDDAVGDSGRMIGQKQCRALCRNAVDPGHGDMPCKLRRDVVHDGESRLVAQRPRDLECLRVAQEAFEDAARDPEPVERLHRERLEDQHVQGTGNQLDPSVHSIAPSRSSCAGASRWARWTRGACARSLRPACCLNRSG